MTLDFDVTRRELSLGTRDSTTGWYAAEYSESTIEMIVLGRGSSYLSLVPGTYVREDAVGLACDPVDYGDQIVTASNQYYEVKGIQPKHLGDSFLYREVDLTLLPLQNLTGDTYTASSVEDARYRTKDYLEQYLDPTDVALPNFIVAYGKPDYPLVKVFKDKAVDLIYSLTDPSSTAMLDSASQAPYGYEEQVAIDVYCIDKSNVSGTKLKWQAEAELRRVCEEHPTGLSLHSLERRGDNDQRMGSLTLYSVRFVLNYRRDTT